MYAKTEFSKWLECQYLEWQTSSGHRQTVSEFAKWLGFKQSIVSLWMNGDRTPGQASADRLALKLGREVYDLLGLEPADPRRVRISEIWQYLTDNQRDKIMQQVDHYLRENSVGYDAERGAAKEDQDK